MIVLIIGYIDSVMVWFICLHSGSRIALLLHCVGVLLSDFCMIPTGLFSYDFCLLRMEFTVLFLHCTVLLHSQSFLFFSLQYCSFQNMTVHLSTNYTDVELDLARRFIIVDHQTAAPLVATTRSLDESAICGEDHRQQGKSDRGMRSSAIYCS